MQVGSGLESNPSDFSLIAREEQSADAETLHAKEPTWVLHIGGRVFAQDRSFADSDPFTYRVQKLPASVRVPIGFRVHRVLSSQEFENPVDLAIAPDGRIFVAEERGLVWIVENGIKLPIPYLDLRAELFHGDADEGALSAIALDPDFSTSRNVYVLFTAQQAGKRFGRLSRYRANLNTPNIANVQSRKIILGATAATGLIQDVFHNVGDIQFGTDGTLLLSWGDTASNQADDPRVFRSQDLDAAAGKLFRINRFNGRAYSSNPFFDGNLDSWPSKVFVRGLRNGFRFSIHHDGGRPSPAPGMPGTLYIADVGRFRSEELNIARGGENFGWPYFEGNDAYQPGGNVLEYDAPTVVLAHPQYRCLIGGVFLDFPEWPANYQGRLLTADFVTGELNTFRSLANHSAVLASPFGSGIRGITSMAADTVGQRVYFLGRGADIIFTSDEGLDGLFYIEYSPN
jgi:glucose/arabinose dehydrogenase